MIQRLKGALIWFILEHRLLFWYCHGWLFKYGVPPYRMYIILIYLNGLVFINGMFLLFPFFTKQPAAGASYVRWTHKFMRGAYPWQTGKIYRYGRTNKNRF